MISLATQYLGLTLRSPIIIGSSGITGSVDKLSDIEKSGAGAVVLKSLFEEQIIMEAGYMSQKSSYPEAEDYLLNYTRSNTLEAYLTLIEQARKKLTIPVIASINCVSSSEWVSFAQNIEQAGANALEINVFVFPNSLDEGNLTYEQLYYDILNALTKRITIPITVKIGQHFSNIPALVNGLYSRGAKGTVLFNRFYSPDIDVDSMIMTSSDIYSTPSDIRHSLRWVGIVSSLVDKIDICASTGIHDGNAVVKQILAGATAVQVCSVLYKKGINHLNTMHEEVRTWMKKNTFDSVVQFKGLMSYKKIQDPSLFERTQFMKYFSNII